MPFVGLLSDSESLPQANSDSKNKMLTGIDTIVCMLGGFSIGYLNLNGTEGLLFDQFTKMIVF